MKLVKTSKFVLISICLFASLATGCSATVTTRKSPAQYNPCGSEVAICRSASATRIVRAKKPFERCGCSAIGEIVY